jgi:esterase/lipase superfamily enzyme
MLSILAWGLRWRSAKSAAKKCDPWLLQYQENSGSPIAGVCNGIIDRERRTMNREYHKWYSPHLGRDMELLVFGHAGLPVIVFPSSCGRFYEFEDRNMVGTLGGKIDAGQLQLFCVDSVDAESWYNRNVGPRWRIARHVQYDDYLIHEVVPLVKQKNRNPHMVALGCSFGGYHALNVALRHPDVFTGMLSMSGAFDLSNFLGGYYDQDCYYNLPTHYLPNLGDSWFLDRYRRNTYVLATGWDDQCLGQNQNMDRIMNAKGIPHKLFIWDTWNSHDWPTWQHMMLEYL